MLRPQKNQCTIDYRTPPPLAAPREALPHQIRVNRLHKPRGSRTPPSRRLAKQGLVYEMVKGLSNLQQIFVARTLVRIASDGTGRYKVPTAPVIPTFPGKLCRLTGHPTWSKLRALAGRESTSRCSATPCLILHLLIAISTRQKDLPHTLE